MSDINIANVGGGLLCSAIILGPVLWFAYSFTTGLVVAAVLFCAAITLIAADDTEDEDETDDIDTNWNEDH